MILLWKNTFSIKKLNLVWNKQTNFNKLWPNETVPYLPGGDSMKQYLQPKKRPVTSSRLLLLFIILSKKDTGCKGSLPFEGFLILLFQNILFSKEFLACSDFLAYLPKSKSSLGLAFGAYFLYTFSIKMFLT